MTEKSNLTIASNVCLRVPELLPEEDPGYVGRISGVHLLRRLNRRLTKLKYNDVQQEELLDHSCSLNDTGEKTHGKVLFEGKTVWSCRCERTTCEQYPNCFKNLYDKRIERTEMPEELDISPFLTEAASYEYLGTDFTNEEEEAKIFSEPTGVPAEEKVEELLPAGILVADQSFFVCDYERLEDPSFIIEAPFDSKIVVNAAPGSGKTYVATERLCHLIRHDNDKVPCENILVLCYTNATENVISEHVRRSVKAGSLPERAKQVSICTFDSLVLHHLFTEGVDFFGLDYNQRVEKFNEIVTPETLSRFEYVIVDELQDLVNDRASMALKILGSIRRGFLLLGDKCETLYDYDCHKEQAPLNSVVFFSRLAGLSNDARKYELVGNRRQVPELRRLSDSMRGALLGPEVQSVNASIVQLMRRWPDSPLKVEDLAGKIVTSSEGETAVLCRNNGEAEYVSTVLHRGGVPHVLLRSSFQPIPLDRWIGDMFWDYCEPQIEKDDFVERYRYRVREDSDEAEERFDNLREICGTQEREFAQTIRMEDLNRVLEPLADVAPSLRCSQSASLTVATVHKAKGREFQKVYFVKSPINAESLNSEEARIRYVAVTRAKQELEVVDKRKNWFCRHIGSGRCLHIETGHKNYKRFTYCGNLAVGLAGDVDPVGFVDESLGDPIEMQNYITREVSIGDKVELLLDKNLDLDLELDLNKEKERYCIYHGGRPIGRLSDSALRDFQRAVSATDRGESIPTRLEDVYVANIVTIVLKDFSERVPLRFRESKMWLGVEITGFAKTFYGDRSSGRE